MNDYGDEVSFGQTACKWWHPNRYIRICIQLEHKKVNFVYSKFLLLFLFKVSAKLPHILQYQKCIDWHQEMASLIMQLGVHHVGGLILPV